MKKKIIYNYEDTRDINTQLVFQLIDKLYSVAWPRTKKTYINLVKEVDDQSHVEGEFIWSLDYYYVPEEVQNRIVDDFLEKHNIRCYWRDSIEFLIKILFQDGGNKESYKSFDAPIGNNTLKKTYEICSTIDKILPQEYCDKLKDVIESYKVFYKFWDKDYNNIKFKVYNYAPCTNRDTTIEAWFKRGVNINIPQDDQWVEEVV